VTLYLYIFIDELPRYEAEGWTLAGKMRPDNWASLNRGNLIVSKTAPDDDPCDGGADAIKTLSLT
jgi:hypothetical protein